MQKRSPNKKQNPNKLALCAGHVVGSETILEALFKEAKEEIGLDLRNYSVKKLTTLKRLEPNNYCFSHQYYIRDKIQIEKLKIQKEELSELVWMNYKTLKDLVKRNSDEVVFKWNCYGKVFDELDKIILK